MAMYIKLLIGDDTIAVFGVQRQEDLTDENAEYTYHADRYTELDSGFCRSKEYKIIKHKYSDKAEILAEKVLQAFNEQQ